MAIRQVNAYIASDNQRFFNKGDAVKHEAELQRAKRLRSLVQRMLEECSEFEPDPRLEDFMVGWMASNWDLFKHVARRDEDE